MDNFDPRKHDENSEIKLKQALEWEKEFVSFMHNYVEKNNRSHLFDLAFNSGKWYTLHSALKLEKSAI